MLAKNRQIGHFDSGNPAPFQGMDIDPELSRVGLRLAPWRIGAANVLVLAHDGAQHAAGTFVNVD
jgi:hypothetical protein